MLAPATTSWTEKAQQYVRDVLEGEIPACRWVKLACQRHLADLELAKQADALYYFDEDAANTVCEIIEHFRHVKGVWARAGAYITLEPWQCFIVCSVFGWKRTFDHARRFRVAYVEVSRKNGKSSLTSGIGNYLTACDNEQGAHVVSAATTRDQARIVFADAQAMARKEPEFLSAFGVEVTAHAISQLSSASKFEAISAEDHSLDGLNLHAALIDELHAHRDRGVWDTLETATGARFQPLVWAITTAGVNRASVCYEQHSYVKDILAGVRVDDSYFGIIYTIDDDDDPFAEASWIKANPNYGISIYPQNFREIAARAQAVPSAQSAFLTKHLCVWANADHSWLPVGAWDKCADLDLVHSDLAGEPCFVGIDLASRSDIAAVVLLFPPSVRHVKWITFGRWYLPEETIERPENTHYQGWERSGRLVSTPGTATDFDFILDDLLDYCGCYDVQEVVSDPWKNLPLISALQKRGVTVPLVDVHQTTGVMNAAMHELEALVTSSSLQHDGDPVFAWMISNVVAHRDAKDNISPRKAERDRKIDGAVALFMSLDRALRAEAPTDRCLVWGI